MRIKLNKIKELDKFTVHILGTEPWLASVYSNLEEGSKLEASVSVSTTLIENRYKVEGNIKISTFLVCRRCLKKVQWNGVINFCVYFIDEREELTRDRDLKESDLDEYWAEELGEINLEIILNDMVQENIPDVVDEKIEHECIDTQDKEQDNYSVKMYSVGKVKTALGLAFENLKKNIDVYRE